MQLSSARELKREFIRDVLEPISSTSPRTMGLAFAAAPMDRTLSTQRLIAIGISPRRSRGFDVAIRLQRRELLRHPSVEELINKAKGEVDIRFVGRAHKRTPRLALKRDIDIFQSRHRPLLNGVSIGHVEVTAGTLGGFVRRRGTKNGKIHVLSNNHVLANENQAALGDSIVQPGTLDGGARKANICAKLTKFVALKLKVDNHVDAAVGAVVDGIDVASSIICGSRKLRLLGSRALDVVEDDKVAKVGRTTGLTSGRITAFEVDDVVVAYDIGNLKFVGQIEIEGTGRMPFSDGGDSGALILDPDGYAVGQLFAGTETGGKNGQGLTYASPIQAVLKQLNVKLVV